MRIVDAFQIRPRFMRSIHLERDFHDETALRGYVLTPHAQAALGRLAGGLAPRSGNRAWRITGDYGTGKSSFALALAHLLSGARDDLPPALRRTVDFRGLGLDEPPQLLPVLVTGAREPLVTALLRALGDALERSCGRGKRPGVLGRIREATSLLPPLAVSDAQALALVRDAAKHILDSAKGTGILIVLDELGKFLEYAALYPERQDIYFLQSLAEAAGRSGENPLLVVGLLHQGFDAYAEQLSHAGQKEWEKVAGRFEEILFNQPLEQTAGLVAEALHIRGNALPTMLRSRMRREMEETIKLGWYGAGAGRRSLVDLAPQLYPLHPSVLPVLVRLFSRFGQNERSLFSFLLSDEPMSLREFADRRIDGGTFYRLHNLYDYTRAAFGHRLAVQSYRSHWNQIESVVESFPRTSAEAQDLEILKSVALLNLLDHPGLVASPETIAVAVDCGEAPQMLAKRALQKLQNERTVLYNRGIAGGYCLWPHTSVNLDRAYQEAAKAIPTHVRVASLIREDLETRPLVARRHYIETGNLRHFEVIYGAVDELGQLVEDRPTDADGRIVVALCETEEERKQALAVARAVESGRDDLLVAVPSPLQSLAKLLQEFQRWEWVSVNVPELNNDGYAAEEVSRQLAAARQVLQRRVRSYVELRQFGEPTELAWFHRGKPLPVANGRELLSKLSDICDRIYDRAPRIRNELVNRHVLSSAAAAARMRLIERIFSHPSAALLGMDEKGKPPEMSMYLSVLSKAGLHREVEEAWAIAEPAPGSDPCHVRPVFGRVREILEKAADDRVRVSDLLAELRRPPYGVRDGLAPLLLAAFVVAHEQEVACYSDGAFLRHMTGHDFQRLVKAPNTFELQYCRVTGVRAAVFERLAKLLGAERSDTGAGDILDVVRPLCVFAAQLPAYTHRTAAIPMEARRVREALLTAEDPAKLLFTNLPAACGLEPFSDREEADQKRVKRFVNRLKEAMDVLRDAYPSLLRRIGEDLKEAFGRSGDLAEIRKRIAQGADGLLVAVAEPKLKAFCLRLADRHLGEDDWLVSLGSLLCSKPPAKWTDADALRFRQDLDPLVGQYRRVESTLFASPRAVRPGESVAFRVSLTNQDGTEFDRVVYLDPEEERRVGEIEESVNRLLRGDGKVAMAAVARALWKRLSEEAPAKPAEARE